MFVRVLFPALFLVFKGNLKLDMGPSPVLFLVFKGNLKLDMGPSVLAQLTTHDQNVLCHEKAYPGICRLQVIHDQTCL